MQEEHHKKFIREKILSYKPDFDPEVLKIGADLFRVRQCSAGDRILKAGEICANIFMVQDSITRCYFVNSDGDEKTIWLEPEKTVITDYESFRTLAPSKCDIYCYEDSAVYAIDRQSLMTLYAQYHDWALFGLQVMEEHYCNVLHFRDIFSFNSASDNYALIESYCARYLDVVPLKHLASWLNISAVHLSRIRKEKRNKELG
ncbi:Crp/Fnr family transcriptional regulator [Kaistella palustris]|uniref:Crp/Fnr family transcriptional regulator n=1 Tax=Kaistella palustris TaxID=493376 RepID=UPI00041316DC|nr:cyclic nucleotide-binding domain-containing protein [Kaistella palustris]